MSEDRVPGVAGPNRRPLLAKDIRIAQEQTRSAAEAARYLHVNYVTYRKYAKMYGLLEYHKTQTRKGISRKRIKGAYGLDAILAGEHPKYDRQKLKYRLIHAGKLKEECYLCGFNEKRVIDGRCPLMICHRDGDQENLRLENLELRCHNCAYLTMKAVYIKNSPSEPKHETYDQDLVELGGLSMSDLLELRKEMYSND